MSGQANHNPADAEEIALTRPGQASTGCSHRRPVVQLCSRWRFFTQPVRGLAMLGTIQSGLEIGALARTDEGRYYQLNGSVIREWHPKRVEPAIERARQHLSERAVAPEAPTEVREVSVTYKVAHRSYRPQAATATADA